MHEIVTFFRHLPRARQGQAVLLLLLMLVAAVLEIGGVVSVMPFLAVLGNPELVSRYELLGRFQAWTGAATFYAFAVYLALAAFLAMAVTAALKVLVQYVAQRYTQAVSGWVSATLFDAYLNQPYVFFLGRNTAQMDQTILSETQNAMAHVLHPVLMICAYSLVLLLLFGALVFIDPRVSLFVLVFFAALYSVIVALVTPLLKRSGERAVAYNEQRYRICGEALRGVKTVKARGLEGTYFERFRGPSSLYTRNQALAQVLAAAPRHIVEALGVGAVMLLALYFMGSTDDLGQTLPLIGVYVLAGNRMLPAAQQIFQSFSQIRYGMPSLRAVLRDLPLQPPSTISSPPEAALPAGFDIEVRELTLRYPGAESDTLTALSFTIPATPRSASSVRAAPARRPYAMCSSACCVRVRGKSSSPARRLIWSPRGPGSVRWATCRRTFILPMRRSQKTSPLACRARRSTASGWSAWPAWRTSTISSLHVPKVMRRRPANGASGSPVASASGSALRARFTRGRAYSCSTRPRVRSTRSPNGK